MSDDSLLPPGDSSDAEEIDDDEAAEASALAQALEGRSGTPRLPDAALETAALLRYSGAAAELSNERRAALREQVLASLPAVSPRTGSTWVSSPRSALWRWLGLGVPLVGAAAALWLVVGAFQQAAQPEPSRVADGRTSAESISTPRDDWAGKDLAVDDQAVSAMTAPQAAPVAAPSARRGAAANERRAPLAEPASSALASRIAAAPSAASPAGPGSRAEASGAGLGAAEAKRSAAPSAPSSERLQRSSQLYRARLLPQLGDPRVDQAHAALDRAQTTAELRQAQTSFTALSSGALGSADESPVSALLRQDIFCRLAEVALRLGQADVALDWARRGLELQAPPSPFGARLWHVEGQARAALGDQDGAAKSYLKAIEVNEQLLDESLDGSE